MRVLITTLFLVLTSTGCWAGDAANPYFQERGPLAMIIIILVPVVIFSGLAATLFLGMVYSFGGTIEDIKLGRFKLRPIRVRAGWQIWLLIIFALAALITSILLFSPAIIIVILIILAATGASIFFINRWR